MPTTEAQSFGLFLAPQLKDLSDKTSPDLEFQLFDFSVLNKLSTGAKGASEAIEFILSAGRSQTIRGPRDYEPGALGSELRPRGRRAHRPEPPTRAVTRRDV